MGVIWGSVALENQPQKHARWLLNRKFLWPILDRHIRIFCMYKTLYLEEETREILHANSGVFMFYGK